MRADQPGRRRRLIAAAVTCSMLIGLVACSDDSEPSAATVDATTAAGDSAATTAPSTDATPANTSAPSAATSSATETASSTTESATDTTTTDTSVVSAEALEWALEYTAGSRGPADGEPVVIGVADAPDSDYPTDPYIDAMAEFINAELGGIGGRPIEIVRCDAVTDPAGCADQLANDPDVVAVIENLLETKEAFALGLGDRKPMLSVDPFIGTPAVGFFVGALQVLTATGLAAAAMLEDGIGRVAIVGGVGTDVVTATALDLAAPDADVVRVVVPEDADQREAFDVDALLASIEAAGAGDVDVVIGFAPVACDIAVTAWSRLGTEPDFVWPNWCDGQDGIVVGDQVDFADPDLASGELTVVEALRSILPPSTDLERESGVLLWSAADLLLLTRVLDEIGVERAATELQGALAAYDGPALFGVGDADCGVRPPTLVSAAGACTTMVEVTRRADGVLDHLDPVDLNG